MHVNLAHNKYNLRRTTSSDRYLPDLLIISDEFVKNSVSTNQLKWHLVLLFFMQHMSWAIRLVKCLADEMVPSNRDTNFKEYKWRYQDSVIIKRFNI